MAKGGASASSFHHGFLLCRSEPHISTAGVFLPFLCRMGDDVVESRKRAPADAADDGGAAAGERERQRPAKRAAAAHHSASSGGGTSSSSSTTTKRRRVVYLCFDERDERFQRGLEKCRDNCSGEVHRHCFQQDGTRHVSMWEGRLSDREERSVRCGSADLPVTISLEPGWNPWRAGNYIGVSADSTEILKGIVGTMNLPRGKITCDHLSLYRRRGLGGNAGTELQRVRTALADHEWGSLRGVSIRIKEVGAPYEDCMVLAEAEGGVNA